MNTILILALVFLVPGLLFLVIGVRNDTRRNEEKRSGTYHSEPSNVFYTCDITPSLPDKHHYIDKRNHRNDEKIARHKSME